MMAVTKPLTEVTQEAITLLLREIGVVNTVRFLNQYSAGYGHYVAEREQHFGHLTLDEIINEIKQDRSHSDI